MAYDTLHKDIKESLLTNGFRSIKDPLSINHNGLRFFIDLEMERNGEEYAIEIKSFNNSFLSEFYKLLGQVLIYRRIMNMKRMKHKLYTAITEDTWKRYFQHEEIPLLILKRYHLNFLTVNTDTRKLTIRDY